MQKEQRLVYFDRDLEIEAYQLCGNVQKFPNHFHEYYVIGFIEGGKRHLWCKGREYDLSAGDFILFNPRDNHYCAPIDRQPLDYRAVNIPVEIMEKAALQIFKKAVKPCFSQTVFLQSDMAEPLAALYDAIVCQAPKLQKEEALFLLLEQVFESAANTEKATTTPLPSAQVQKICTYLQQHFSENITLDELLTMTDFGKSYLLRVFTKQTGVSPYRYLQTVRIERAKQFLAQGMPPADAALLSGFSDQSHFTNYFKEFIGLTPKQYQRIFSGAGREGGEKT